MELDLLGISAHQLYLDHSTSLGTQHLQQHNAPRLVRPRQQLPDVVTSCSHKHHGPSHADAQEWHEFDTRKTLASETGLSLVDSEDFVAHEEPLRQGRGTAWNETSHFGSCQLDSYRRPSCAWSC